MAGPGASSEELLVPAGMTLDTAAAALLARMALRDRGEHTRDTMFLDTFDGRARAAGLTVAHSGGRLTVTPGPAAAWRRPGRPFRVDAVTDGPVRAALEPVVGVRALRPRARVFARERAFDVLDGEEKTVARVRLLAPAVSAADHSLALLRGRAELEGLRGYGKELARVREVLTDELGFVPAEEALGDAAIRALGGDPSGFAGGLRTITLAAGEPAGAALRDVLAAHVRVIEANVAGVLEDIDIEHLHDLRVAVRRLRAVLRELRGVPGTETIRPLRDELRWLQAVTGPVRDLDIALLDFDALADLVRAGELGGALEPLRAVLGVRRRRSFAALRRTLRSERFSALLTFATAAPLDGPNAAEPVDALAAGRVRRLYRHMVRRGRAINPDSPPEALHDLRKQGKELRYLLEIFGAMFDPATVRPLVRALKTMQETLGRHQDRAVQAELIASLLTGTTETRTVMAAGALVERLREDEGRARSEFAGRFAEFAARDVRHRVRETFR